MASKLFKRCMRKLKMEHCGTGWSFGKEGEENHKLANPCSIATNSLGHFIVADDCETVKVFSENGKFLFSFIPSDNDELAVVGSPLQYDRLKLATDHHDNIYVLVTLEATGRSVVFVYDQHANLQHKFGLGDYFVPTSFTVNDNKQVIVIPWMDNKVVVYGADGEPVRTFEGRISDYACDIAAANKGRLLVLEEALDIVSVLSVEGDFLYEFYVDGDVSSGAMGKVAFHQESESVVISSRNPDTDKGQVSIYSIDGQFVRSIQMETNKKPNLQGLAVTKDGLVAVADCSQGKIHVMQMETDI